MFFYKMYLKESHTHPLALPLTGSFPKWVPWPRLGQAKPGVRSFFWAPMRVQGPKDLGRALPLLKPSGRELAEQLGLHLEPMWDAGVPAAMAAAVPATPQNWPQAPSE